MEGWKFSNRLGQSKLFEWAEQFKERRTSVADEHLSGLPSAVTCVEVKQMDQRIRENRKRISTDDTESDMNISHSASTE